MHSDHDIIVAPATAPGGALAVVRTSGAGAAALCDRIFRGRTPLAAASGYSVHYGRIVDGDRTIDDVLATLFRAPHSYTGEDSVEFSCHGSPYIVSEVLRLLRAAGARMAEPGEFTVRAYLAGKLDLAQAEAVADLIASSSRAAHALASAQLRGGYSAALDALRDRLLELVALLELELDFSEEEVAFADRSQLHDTMAGIRAELDRLHDSFRLGNALKEGVAVALVGAPNVGKSTLLNRLLGEERAMVSELAGTTRDVIEECIDIGGVRFRLLDTAGLRTTDDRLERMGIARTLAVIDRARIVVRLVDAAAAPASPAASGFPAAPGSSTAPGFPTTPDSPAATSTPAVADSPVTPDSPAFPAEFALRPDQTLLTVFTKTDLAPVPFAVPEGAIGISALRDEGIDRLRAALLGAVDTGSLCHGDPIVSNGRHCEALADARRALEGALAALRDGLPADLLSEELRQVVRSLGTIAARGAIAPDEVLRSIFSKFCIGK